MSRIYDALKKAERERSGGPEPAEAAPVSGAQAAAADSAAQPAAGPAPQGVLPAAGDDLPAGAWGVIPDDGLMELAGVRRRVEAQLPGRTRFALGMLGSVRGEGATTTVLGYARTLASDARLRILMVDAEGVDRTISKTWADAGGAGWSDLASPAQVSSVVRRTPLPNLHVLPFGSRSAASPAQLAELLVEATRHVAQQYDYVLFDLGSVLQTPTAHYLAGAMDGILLVVHASGTRREICQKAVEELRKTDTPVLGVVLNRRRYVIPEAVYKRI